MVLHLLLNSFGPLPDLMIFRVIPHPNTRFHQMQLHALAMISYHQLQPTDNHNLPVLSIPHLPILSGVIPATVRFRGSVNSSTRHKNCHDKPFKCTKKGCTLAFQSSKDRTRHYNTKHPELLQEPTTYFCRIEGCKRGFKFGRGFSRKDGLDRHLKSHARKGEI
ncbi:hypothetical protein BDW42DRAFT_33093 [Aspergillus taichungensis]|uniref:C2H2-type domain-containing protein n=1 Tax=Aspergillus taichungensis TaxID=482145 RepID=A0A2J5HFW8_9EURO|nr:hypothetical protein BDW42DRAFT_33093 [Aspergillus taichungensis]